MNEIPEIPISRNDLLKILPNNNVAEIGVAEGKFSESILRINKPKKLYLIDVWENIKLDYQDSNMLDNEKQEKRFIKVKEKFGNNRFVEIIRQKSKEASRLFKNFFFDWVYIDADHSFDGCLSDLNCYDHLVKDYGYIWGDDFINIQKRGYGVNEAVIKFIKDKNYIFSFLTLDKKRDIMINNNSIKYKNGSFVISKNKKSHDIFMKKLKSIL